MKWLVVAVTVFYRKEEGRDSRWVVGISCWGGVKVTRGRVPGAARVVSTTIVPSSSSSGNRGTYLLRVQVLLVGWPCITLALGLFWVGCVQLRKQFGIRR